MDRKNKSFWRTVAGKALLFLAINLCIAAAFMCVVVAGACVSENFYERTDEEYYEESDKATLDSCVMQNANLMLGGYGESVEGIEMQITDGSGEVLASTAGYEEAAKYNVGLDYTYPVQLIYNSDGEYKGMGAGYVEEGDRLVKATIVSYLDPRDFTAHSDTDKMIISTAYSLRYAVFPLAAFCALAGIAAYIALICVAGRQPGTDVVVRGPLMGVPFDVLAVGTLFVCMLLYVPGVAMGGMGEVVVFCAATFLLVNACLGLTVSLAARVKSGCLIKGTLVYKLCRLIVKAFSAIPLVARTIVILLGISFVEFIYILANHAEGGRLVLGWLLTKVLLYPVVLYIAWMLRKLRAAGAALASGDISSRCSTTGLVLDFKAHAADLNRVSDAVGLAVEDRLKSERMKTELITNVSHDIKTPLTSIINYASLMGAADPADPKMAEYSEVVVRQSDKLKRLIEDLVEASKASTGNLEIVPAPLDCCTFVTQTAGEFKEKLEAASLSLVCSAPEEPVIIMADGRRMMRIYDNLMNNICKYAQPGTRVYLTLEVEDGVAVTTFKNTSAAELGISADELVERFVRGDASRNTEGNGLGLSIAKSMTELQGGTFEIAIDGDLFKVVVKFPVVGEADEAAPAET